MIRDDKHRRRTFVGEANRATVDDARAAMHEVIASFEGYSYDELAKRVDATMFSRKVTRDGREYTVLLDVANDVGPRGPHLLLNFQVDDGGRHLLPPETQWFTVHPGETFTPDLPRKRQFVAAADLPALPKARLGRYRHYKGGEYEVMGVVRHSETLEALVLYRPLYNDSGLWVRPYAMFFEEVEHEGRRQPRFDFVG